MGFHLVLLHFFLGELRKQVPNASLVHVGCSLEASKDYSRVLDSRSIRSLSYFLGDSNYLEGFNPRVSAFQLIPDDVV